MVRNLNELATLRTLFTGDIAKAGIHRLNNDGYIYSIYVSLFYGMVCEC